MVGAVSDVLAVTVEYARSRIQFGRAIGSYQAVKHKLAEVKVAVETAQLGADDAWSDAQSAATTLAKVHAGDAVKLANKHCLQVLGGIGFTWEHSFHTYYRRGLLLDSLLGSAEHLADDLGRTIAAEQRLPAVSVL
jgi:alkylation response protein AidB-like acyl-CoA dehydrogenase